MGGNGDGRRVGWRVTGVVLICQQKTLLLLNSSGCLVAFPGDRAEATEATAVQGDARVGGNAAIWNDAVHLAPN